MDISEAQPRGPAAQEREPEPEPAEDPVGDERGEAPRKSLKRSSERESITSKKRRKQLKPIRIATNLEDMVKVPKQIIGLNNDLDNVNDLTHTVPKHVNSDSHESPLATDGDADADADADADGHYSSPLRFGTSAGEPDGDAAAAIDGFRGIEAPEAADRDVPPFDAGPNYPGDPRFAFPLTFRPAANSPFWSEATLKIFNQEAYCELCKKEFCNKYFLKTHKANKHGIYAEVPAAAAAAAAAAAQSKAHPGKDKEGKVPENGKTAGEGDCVAAFCDLCNKKFCNKYFVRRHKTKSHGLAEEPEGEAKPVQNPSQNSTKEAESTLAARRPAALDRGDRDNHTGEEEPGEQEGPLNLIVGAKGDSDNEENDDAGPEKAEADGEADADADDCSTENIEKLQTMLLRLNPSETEGKACRVCNEVPDGSADHKCVPGERKDRDYLSEANDSSSESKTEFALGKSESHDFVYVHHLKQAKPTNSYCEICNKELCNKYFMRTHMQRMHGIEIEHGTQIGGVVCNICNKELCSKYFLRVHKQNTHGVASPNAPLGPSTSGGAPGQRAEGKAARADSRLASHFSQACYICNKRFRSPKWLQAHFLSDHRPEEGPGGKQESGDPGGKEEEPPRKGGEPPEALDVISKIFWEKAAASKTYNCSQCPFSTAVLAFLFVHERSHYVLGQDPQEAVKPSASLQDLIHDKTFWQHKVTQQVPECLDLSGAKPKCVAFEQNGS